MIFGLAADLNAGFRTARQNPTLALLITGTLGVGIAVSTAVFSWVDSVLLHPIPGAVETERLASLEEVPTTGQTPSCAYPDYRDFQKQADLFSGLAASHLQSFMIGEGTWARRVYGQIVSANYFAVLGVAPVTGRVFSYSEDRDTRAAYPLAVISHRLWNAQFRADPKVIGTTVRVNGHALTVVGVAPPEFIGSYPGLALDVWVHLSMIDSMGGVWGWPVNDRNAKPLTLIGRLKPGVTVAQASAQAESIAQRIAALYPDTHAGTTAKVVPLSESQAGVQSVLGAPLRILLAASCLVLLIASANIGNLLLARAVARVREYAVRLAVGAGRWRVLREVISGSVVLGLPGLVAGLVMAMWMGQATKMLLPATDMPIAGFVQTQLNGRVLLFSSAVALISAILSGLVPALHASRCEINIALQQNRSRASTAGARSARIRGFLVTTQVAAATIGVLAAALLSKSFRTVSTAELGFDPKGVQQAELYLASAGYTAEQEKLFCRRLKDALAGAPGIEAASYAIETPLLQGGDESIEVQGYTPRRGESMVIPRNNVGPGYFRVMRIPLLAGRDFTDRDDKEGPLPVAIVNEAFVGRYFGGADPVGRKMRIALGPWATIVGVVKNSKYGGPMEVPRPYYYAPFQQYFGSGHQNRFFVRSSAGPIEAANELRAAIAALDPTAGIATVEPLQASVDLAMYANFIAARLMTAAGVLALLLAAVGLYSMMSYAVSERTQEIGIRIALGAEDRVIGRMVMSQVARLTVPGLVIGGVVGTSAALLARGMLAGISPADPVAVGVAWLALSVLAVLAGLAPAVRAMHIAPLEALRYQ